MAVFTISTFATFTGLLLAARKLATDPDPINGLKALADLATSAKALAAVLAGAGLSPLAKEMETCARDADAAFGREPAAEGARALFWQTAPTALADPALMTAGGLNAGTVTNGMVEAILASPHGADFGRTPMAERYFRAVALPTLAKMLASADFIASIAPDLWRRTLAGNGIQIALLERLDSKIDALPDTIVDRLLAELDRRGEAAKAHRAGLTDERILTLARRITANVSDLDGAFAELDRAVTVAIEVQTRGALRSNAGHFVDAVLARMSTLSAENRDAEAAAEADRAFAEWEEHQRRETQKGIALLEAGLRADILSRDAASVARRIARRLELESPDSSHHFANLSAQQEVWYARGSDRGLNLDVEVSIDLARLAYTAARDASERGHALTEMAISLATLGERETAATRLEEAIATFRAALEEWTRERVPLDWAITQMNLGNALRVLGERESCTAHSEEAVAAFHGALEELTRERVPFYWAVTQMNLGIALKTLGERESGTARLEDAVVAFHAALEELTRERAPLDWAATQMNLGNALLRLGERASGTARLEQAVAAYRAALEELTRERVPLDWAMTQMNLGNALKILGERVRGTAQLEEALVAYCAALEERTRERAPLDWARTQINLGNALKTLGERESSTERLEEAVAAYRAALAELIRERVPLDWATAQMNLGNALQGLGERASDSARLEQAVAAYRAALEELTRDRVPIDWARTKTNLAIALTTLADRSAQTRASALPEIDAALEVFRTAGADAYVDWAERVRAWIAAGGAR